MDKVLCSLKFICKATTSNVFPILPTHVVALLAQPCKFVFVSKLLDASIIPSPLNHYDHLRRKGKKRESFTGAEEDD